MSFMKSAGLIVGTIKVWENRFCELLPIKTILAVCIIVILYQLNAIKSDVTSIERDVSSIEWKVSSIENELLYR